MLINNDTNSKYIIESDAIIMLGTKIIYDNPELADKVNLAIENQGAEFIYMHPMDDDKLSNKYTQFIKYEAGSEEGVLALLCSYLIKNIDNSDIKAFLDDLDIGYLSGESSVGEEEFDLILENIDGKKNKVLVIGSDIFGHAQSKNIGKLIALIDKYTDFKVLVDQLNDNQNETQELQTSNDIEEVSMIKTYNGTVVYSYVPKKHSNTAEEKFDNVLKGSTAFAQAAKIKPDDTVNVIYGDASIKCKFVLDKNIKGTIAMYPALDSQSSTDPIFSGYRFKQVKIEKVDF